MQKRITDFMKSGQRTSSSEVKMFYLTISANKFSKTGNGIFNKKTFIFIPYDNIDKTKTDFMIERIRKNGGMTFRIDFFDWKPSLYVELYIIVSKNMPYQVTNFILFLISKQKRNC